MNANVALGLGQGWKQCLEQHIIWCSFAGSGPCKRPSPHSIGSRFRAYGSSFFCRPNDEARSSTTIVCALKKLQRVQDKCPVAVLVGVDATPEPGLRGPTNFAGTLHGEAVQGLNQTLTATRHASLSASDRSTALIISFAILLVIEQTHDVPFCFTTHHQR